MSRTLATAAVLAALSASPALAVDIEVGYPYSFLFDTTFQKIMGSFETAHPDIHVTFRATYENYEDATNAILREAVSNTLPDVTFQGLNRQALLVDKGIAKPLDPFIAKEADFQTEGYHEAMLGLSTINGGIYGLPFAISLPIGYYNMDLLAKAGVADLPKTWDDVIAACGALRTAGVQNPLYWSWDISGNWFPQALMWSQGEPIIKDGAFTFGGPAGLTALETMQALFEGCAMRNLSYKEASASFSAGEMAMVFYSTAAVESLERSKGDFTLKTGAFPGIGGAPLGLPAGGNAAMLVSTSDDPARVEAAWTFLKYVTSGIGAAAVAETTGYMPPNKAVNEVLLADFYKTNPNKETAVRQLPLLRDWQAYPGEKGLAITQVIHDGVERLVVGGTTDLPALQKEIVDEVEELMPRP
jgi:multiple sugar transport system substrate-binding protein